MTIKTRIERLEQKAGITTAVLIIHLTNFDTIWDKLSPQEQLTIRRDIERQENVQRAKGVKCIVVGNVPNGYK